MNILDSLPKTIFREYQASSGQKSDRSAGDRAAHRRKIKGAIKDNLADILSEESIIGKSGDTIIKVPIKGIKEYRFVYGDNQGGAAQGDGNSQPGQVVGKKGQEQEKGNKAGNQAGEDIYETEITLDELTTYLFEELQLPNLERTSIREIINKSKLKKDGYRRVGIQVRLDRRKTAKQRVMRKMATQRHGPLPLVDCEVCEGRGGIESEGSVIICKSCEGTTVVEKRFRFRKEDQRFKHMDADPKPQSNAAIIFVMDTSGSMDTNKKFLARSFFYLLYLFIRARYDRSEVIFIAHTSDAKEVTEDEFFHKGESGGTMISSGLNKAIEVINDRYNPSVWNNYVIHMTDGDNFEADNAATVKAFKELCEICSLVAYGEIKPGGSGYYESSMLAILKEKIDEKNFRQVKITEKLDIWPKLKLILSLDDDVAAVV